MLLPRSSRSCGSQRAPSYTWGALPARADFPRSKHRGEDTPHSTLQLQLLLLYCSVTKHDAFPALDRYAPPLPINQTNPKTYAQARLLKAFCPILRFDAAEKHFPITAEAFISSSLLLRQEKKHLARNQPAQSACPPSNTPPPPNAGDRSSDGDTTSDSVGSDLSAAEGETDDSPAQLAEEEGVHEQACGECGESKGWRVPLNKGWTVVSPPRGTQCWDTDGLLEEQRKYRKQYRFRCDPQSACPEYAEKGARLRCALKPRAMRVRRFDGTRPRGRGIMRYREWQGQRVRSTLYDAYLLLSTPFRDCVYVIV